MQRITNGKAVFMNMIAMICIDRLVPFLAFIMDHTWESHGYDSFGTF